MLMLFSCKIQLLCISPESLLTDHRWREMLRSDVCQEMYFLSVERSELDRK